MPKSIGNETISVPAKLMYVLAALWEDYKTAPKPNLGKSFGLNPNEQEEICFIDHRTIKMKSILRKSFG